jgi:predicted enzyme related to lactoylglutathione lyase
MAAAPTTFKLDRIGQIAVRAKDLDRAVRFYRDTLGMRFLFQAPPQMAFFDVGGVRLLVGVPEKAEFDHPAAVIYYKVDDIQAAHAALVARGVAFITPPHLVARLERADLWLADFHDSEGNTLVLMSEVPAPRP